MDSGELYNESTIGNETCISLNDYLLDDWTTYFSVRAIFTILYSIIIFFGVGGNLCVIVSILRTRSLQTVSNYFIFSLSCSDLIVCLVSSTITPFTAFVKNWLFGFWMCSFVSTLGGTSIIFSTLTLTAISFDRFILICRPTNSPLSKRQAFIWIFVNVVIGITFSSPSGYHSVVKTNVKQFCGSFCYEEWPNDTETTRLIYSLAIYTLQFVLPLTIIISCYTLISLRLNERLTLKTNKDKSSRVESDQQRAAIKRNTRTNRMLIGMVSAFLLSQLPNVAYNVARDLNAFPYFVEKQTYLYGIVTHLTSMTSTIWNPFLYAALNNSLRDAFLQLMPNCIQGKLHFLKKKDGGSIRHKGGVNAKIKTFKKPYNGTSFANNGSELMDCQESTKLTNAVETSQENSVQYGSFHQSYDNVKSRLRETFLEESIVLQKLDNSVPEDNSNQNGICNDQENDGFELLPSNGAPSFLQRTRHSIHQLGSFERRRGRDGGRRHSKGCFKANRFSTSKTHYLRLQRTKNEDRKGDQQSIDN
uniref:G_PROTEIN_RECEP_F1_2 domain-containing protein n=1 Tax=Rhabditophanes sp. KR3021 TaxID=114890 RepID=A0AC35UGR5_9BILA